jgi:hypothetical protein
LRNDQWPSTSCPPMNTMATAAKLTESARPAHPTHGPGQRRHPTHSATAMTAAIATAVQ